MGLYGARFLSIIFLIIRRNLCSIGQDQVAYIWEASEGNEVFKAALRHLTQAPIASVDWEKNHEDWIAFCFNNCFEMVKIDK